MKAAFPNPSKGITCIPVAVPGNIYGRIYLTDMLGREIITVFEGTMQKGERNYFVNTYGMRAGVYLLNLASKEGRIVQKLIVL